MSRKALVLSTICTMAFLIGCGGSIISDSRVSAAISPKSSWAATGDFKDISAAIDGNVSKVAVTNGGYENAKLTVDLGKPCVFNMIALDQGQDNQFNFCRRMTVAISYDGVNFRQIYAAPGTRRITYVCLISPTIARYIRFQATVPGDKPWAVAEVYLQ